MNLPLNFSRKTVAILAGLIFLGTVTLVNVWLARETTQPITQAQSQVTRLYWLPLSVIATQGQGFAISLAFDPGQNPISALDIIITYDPELLELQTTSLNQEIGTFPVQKTEPGKLTFSVLPKDFETHPQFPAGILANLNFAAKTSGATQITIDSSSIAAYAGKNFLVLDTDSKLKVEIK